MSETDKIECKDGVCKLIEKLTCDKCGEDFENCICDIRPSFVYQVEYVEQDGSIEYYICDKFKTALNFCVELLNTDIDKNMPLLHFKHEKIEKIDEDKFFKDDDRYKFNSFINIRKVPIVVSRLIDTKYDFSFEDLLYFREYPEKKSKRKCCRCDSESDSDY